jgi:hypothetical protein
MKRKFLPPFGILSAGVLAASITCSRAQQVYSQGTYSAGTTYFDVCSTTLPFVPYRYRLTEISWQEDTDGFTIMDIGHKPAPGDVSRRRLQVESGSERFILPGDSGSLRGFKSGDDPPIVKGSGDFASAMTKYATNRGCRAITNALPAL